MLDLEESAPLATDAIPLEEVQVVELPAATEFDPIAAGEKMAKETVVFEIHIGRPGFRKPIPPATFIRKIKEAAEGELSEEQRQQLDAYRASIVTTTDAEGKETDTTMLHVSQDVIDMKEVKKIAHFDGRFSNWIKAQAIPSPMLAAGMYQIHLSRTEAIDVAVTKFLIERKKLIAAFRDKYPDLKEQAKARRFPFYNEADYPAWEEIEKRYTVEARYLSFNVPAALERINNEIYQREKEKVKLQWADAAQEARDAQRIAAQTLLNNVVEMLGKDETGKRKTFRPKAMKKLQEFLAMFREMNLTGDIELEKILDKTKDIMAGMDPAEVRKDVTLRDTLLDAVSKVKEQAAGLVVTRERKVVFEEDEDTEEQLPAETESVDSEATTEEGDQDALSLEE